MPTLASIDIKGLSKRYPRTKEYALKNLSLCVRPGEVYGFLGPNGAGKSTTIRTLLNFIQPTSGSATILGKDIVKESVLIKQSVGYLSNDMTIYPSMSGSQFLSYMSELQTNIDKRYKQELIHKLKADINKKLGNLSRGNRQKFAIIQAFMNKPEVLILDEPSSGLDPLMQEVFYSLLRESRDRGAAIFMSSHILSEVQKVCDRVGIIRNGRLIAERSIAEMAKDAAHTFDVTFKTLPPVDEIKRIKGVELESHDNNRVSIRVKSNLPLLLNLLAKHEVTQLEVRQLDLEEMFMHYYKGGEDI